MSLLLFSEYYSSTVISISVASTIYHSQPPNNLRNHCNTHVYTRYNKIGLTVHSFSYSYSISCSYLEGIVYFCVFSSTGPGFSPLQWFLQAFACSWTKTDFSLQNFRGAAFHTKCGDVGCCISFPLLITGIEFVDPTLSLVPTPCWGASVFCSSSG